MSTKNKIRPVTVNDLAALKAVIDASELFPSNMLEDMMSDYFGNDNSQEIWLTSTVENLPVAVAFSAPEKMTEGT